MFVTLSNCAKRLALIINLEWLPAVLATLSVGPVVYVCLYFEFDVALLFFEGGGWVKNEAAAARRVLLLRRVAAVQPHLMCQ